MSKRAIPVDNAAVRTAALADEDWERARQAPERLRELLRVKPRAQARYDAVLSEIHARQLTLRRLREARAQTQSAMAELLGMDQSEVSRLEHRSDMLLSTLKRFIEATGGELHLIVRYEDGGPVELLVSDEQRHRAAS
jgi:hypothetical protein